MDAGGHHNDLSHYAAEAPGKSSSAPEGGWTRREVEIQADLSDLFQELFSRTWEGHHGPSQSDLLHIVMYL